MRTISLSGNYPNVEEEISATPEQLAALMSHVARNFIPDGETASFWLGCPVTKKAEQIWIKSLRSNNKDYSIALAKRILSKFN